MGILHSLLNNSMTGTLTGAFSFVHVKFIYVFYYLSEV